MELKNLPELEIEVMKKYFRIYRILIRFSVLRLLVYRANLLNNILSSLLWGILLFVSMYLLTSHSTSVFGLTIPELMLVTGAYNTMIGVFHCMFSHNFERLSRTIRYGELDSILLKPIDSHFFVSTQYLNIVSLSRVPLGILSMIYIIHISNISVRPMDVFFFSLFLVFGIILLYSLWSIVTTLLIYFPRMQNIVSLMFSVSGFSRYPRGMYQQFGSLTYFLFFPFTLVVLVAVASLVHTVTIQSILSLILLSLSSFVIAHYFWYRSLRSYASASS